jgi:hypothetical protein
MKRAVLITLALLAVIVPVAQASQRLDASTRTVPAAQSDSLNVFDSWHGQVLSIDYHACDAVATVHVSGEYDVERMPDGTLSVVLGLTGSTQRISIVVDGLHRHCFG